MEDEMEMSKEEFRRWIRDQVEKIDILQKYNSLQSLLERRKKHASNLLELSQSVTECEKTVKELYSLLGWEYRDADSDDGEERTFCGHTQPFQSGSSRCLPTCKKPAPQWSTTEDKDNWDRYGTNGRKQTHTVNREAVVVLDRLSRFQINKALCQSSPQSKSSEDSSFSSHESDKQWEPSSESSDSDFSYSEFSVGSNKRRKVIKKNKLENILPTSHTSRTFARKTKDAKKTTARKRSYAKGKKPKTSARLENSFSDSDFETSAKATTSQSSRKKTTTPPSNTTKTGTPPSNTTKTGTPPSNTTKTGTPPSNTTKTGTPPSNTTKTTTPQSNTTKTGTPPSNTTKTTAPQSNTTKTGTPLSNTTKTTTPQSNTTKTTAPQSNTTKTGTPLSNTTKTTTPQSNTTKTTAPQSNTTKTGTPLSNTTKTTTPQSNTTKTTAPQSNTTKTGTPLSNTTKTTTPQSNTTKTATPQSNTTKMAAAPSNITKTATPQSNTKTSTQSEAVKTSANDTGQTPVNDQSSKTTETPPSVPQVELSVNMTVLARRRALNWQLGKITEIITKEDGRIKYKVIFEEKGRCLVSGHHVAFENIPTLSQLFVGARVVIKQQADFLPGVLVELPSRKNRMRFLVFVDDHTPVYIGLPLLHLVCRPLPDPLADIPDENHRNFLKRYLKVWPYPPLTQYRIGNMVNIEHNGIQQKCEVIKIDCSLMEVTFKSDDHKEWIFRGSMRLEHIVRLKKENV